MIESIKVSIIYLRYLLNQLIISRDILPFIDVNTLLKMIHILNIFLNRSNFPCFTWYMCIKQVCKVLNKFQHGHFNMKFMLHISMLHASCCYDSFTSLTRKYIHCNLKYSWEKRSKSTILHKGFLKLLTVKENFKVNRKTITELKNRFCGYDKRSKKMSPDLLRSSQGIPSKSVKN